MNYILYDDPVLFQRLQPLTYLRPISYLRIGIFTLAEKWEKYLGQVPAISTMPYLQRKFPEYWHPDNIVINSSLCPDEQLLQEIKELEVGEAIFKESTFLAARVNDQGQLKRVFANESFIKKYYLDSITSIRNVWDIFKQNGKQLRNDFQWITEHSASQNFSDMHTVAYHPEQIYIEQGAKLKACVLDAENGPIYIGKNAFVHPGAIITGPFALCEGSHVNPGAKMRGDTTIGPFCKVGGEISNSVILGYSNKGHDGFLGNSVLGEWCNLGADTNTSNLKNNYAHVRSWDYNTGDFEDSGEQFLGLIMGDHSKCGINTMFNTGTVVGICSNVFDAGFPPKFIPSFLWGGKLGGWAEYDLERLFDGENRMMVRRNKELTEDQKEILNHLFTQTRKERLSFM